MATDRQIEAWGRKHISDWLGVFEADRLPAQLPANCSMVVSYGKLKDAAKHGNSVLHWCGFIKRGSWGLWLDPMGRPPDADAYDLHIRKPGFAPYLRHQCPAGYKYQKTQLENWGGSTCGEWSLALCRAGGGPKEAPSRWRWLSSSIRENQSLVRKLVRL